jgi:chromosomal replication initiation ATPase DnaA
MTRQTFDTWLRDTRLVARAGPYFTVAVKNSYAADWLEHRLLPVIQRVLAGLIGERGKTEPSSLTVKFVVADG